MSKDSKKSRKEWRDFTSTLIKDGVVDAALAFATKGWSLINRGPIKWITEKLLEYLWDKTGTQVVKFVMRKGWLAYDVAAGAIRVKKINKAKDENDSSTYWDTLSDI